MELGKASANESKLSFAAVRCPGQIVERTNPAPAGKGIGSPETVCPVLPTIFRDGEIRPPLFATISQFGRPEDSLLDDPAPA
jgi:hypothetical protein